MYKPVFAPMTACQQEIINGSALNDQTMSYIIEPRHDKTNIVCFDQHGSRPACASARSDLDPSCFAYQLYYK
jgi:hypothetical protein